MIRIEFKSKGPNDRKPRRWVEHEPTRAEAVARVEQVKAVAINAAVTATLVEVADQFQGA